jgi:hypothetical protein
MEKNSTAHGNKHPGAVSAVGKFYKVHNGFYMQEKERNHEGSDAPDPDSYVFGRPGSGAGSVISL